ncbi:MAG: caspase family protein [Deltaproteobacteria bacterium]|nr:caspase family protein [Deltaproteobacteria bacterium]
MMTNRTGRTSLSIIVAFFCAFWALVNSGLASSRGIRVIKDLDHQSGKIGTYRAFIIGIQDYNDARIPDLETPIKDAQVMAELLRKHYGFVVETLLDRKATRSAIYGALRNLSAKAKPGERVLV